VTFFQLLPVPQLQDLGPLPYSLAATEGLLTVNKSMSVNGGSCPGGYLLRVFDFTTNSSKNYYWDSAGRPSGPSNVCTGRDPGPYIANLYWIDADVFLSVNSLGPALVTFSLNPIAVAVISYPARSNPMYAFV